MPSVDVAPIYSSPWLKQHYEGMARLLERVPDVAEKTLEGVTCQLWCVRFFYVVINVRRWVDVAEISTWQDTEDRYAPICPGDPMTYHVYDNTCVRLEAVDPIGSWKSVYIAPPNLKVDDVVLGFGFDYSIATAMHADSQCGLMFRKHSGSDPATGATTIWSYLGSFKSNTYVSTYRVFDTPYTIVDEESYVLRLRMFAKEVDANNGFIYMRAVYLRVERTI